MHSSASFTQRFKNLHRAGENLLRFGRKAHVSDNHNSGSVLYPSYNECDSEPTCTIHEPGEPVTCQNVRRQKAPP